ncbi:ParB/RepB/Spo0J family partition protein [Shimia aestuarii]|uniref:ParB/RepB/Spo0J family partition protein n=1 Tax=Shimia aestuarii TaxID=254406 RepID=UPI001FB25ADC|nr:ParB/RepB/Spo0J family partition protein [Shimia aestuarii]
MTHETRMIPSDKLYLHPFNPRQDTDEADTLAMAESIETCGLIQNLSGYADETSDGIGIVAGGRRMRAIQLLAERNGGDPIEVPVRVTEDFFEARAWAGAENSSQKPLHPADEIRAYAQMADQGGTVPMIARAFAVREGHVNRRLKLSKLPETALDALKENRITLDAARALTVCDDPSSVLAVLEQIDGKDISAERIKQMLTPDAIPSTDRRAVFVGLDTYRAEGGALTEDLFAEGARLHNEELLDTLFKTKLEMECERIKEEEGWQNVVPVLDHYVTYTHTEKLERIYPTPVDLPEADAEELEQLEEIGIAGLSEEGQARLKELAERERGDYTDEDRETGTVFVYVRHSGELQVERAYVSKKRAKKSADTEKAGGGEKPRMPQNCLDDLRSVQTLALQTAMLGKPDLLLDILAWQIESGVSTWSAPLDVKLGKTAIEPEKSSNTTIDGRLVAVEETDHDAKFSAEQLHEFQLKGKKHRNAILAAGLARAITAPGFTVSRDLLDLVEIDIRKLWTPDAENFFSRIRPDLLDGIWADLLELEDDDERRADFAKLKRAQKAKELEDLFSNASVQEAHGLSRDQVARIDAWLPEEME